MSRRMLFTLVALAGVVLSAACTTQQANPTGGAEMPNPASVYCEQNGGRLEIRTAADGSQSGVCVFPDGSECDEWAYFRGECKSGEAPAAPEPTVAPAETVITSSEDAAFASDGCKTYGNVELGYTFHYPAYAEIATDDDPSESVTFIGPLAGDERWPQITISHPSDRPDYRPPEGADLRQWLTDHDLLGDQEQPDLQIAGTTAIHLRHDPSPQSYAYDRYYFARSGQLYMVAINHAGDKEDWTLYNHFLQSIQFEDQVLNHCPCESHTPASP